jgi:Polyketide cyclase / dehydrase and lipid transport
MASLRHEIRINAPADTVYEVFARPESIPEWFPGIVAATVEGNVRTITMASGLAMPEEIDCNDSHLRRFAYRITAPVYKYHLGIIDAIALSDNETLCVYSTTAEPSALCLIIAGATVGALEQIKRIAEEKMA